MIVYLPLFPLPVSDRDNRFPVIGRRVAPLLLRGLLLSNGLEHGLLQVPEAMDDLGLPQLS